MILSPDNPQLRALCRRFLGVLLVLFGVCIAASSAAEVSLPASAEAGSVAASTTVESAGDSDRCDDECPGELPDGECPDGCGYCGCCGSVAPSVLPDCTSATLDAAPSRHVSPKLSSVAPTGVPRAVFKPPRPFSA